MRFLKKVANLLQKIKVFTGRIIKEYFLKIEVYFIAII